MSDSSGEPDSRLLPILPEVWRQDTGFGESKAMGKSEFDQLLDDYTRRITDQSDEAKLIKSVPWLLGIPGELADLFRGLQLEASRFCDLPHQLRFSLIVPMSNTPHRFLNDLILSVRCQSWFRWELILIDEGSERREHLPVAERWAEEDDRIRFLTMDRRRGRVAAKNAALEAAAGDFVCMLDDSALLHPCALGMFARQLNASKEINLIFSHEALLEEGATRIRRYLRKPDFDLFTLLRHNYVGHLTAIRTDLLLAVRKSGKVFRTGYDGVEDHDLMIRLAVSGKVQATSLPFYLYYSRNRSKPSASTEGAGSHDGAKTLRLIEEYLPEIYPGSRWTIIPPSTTDGNEYPGIHLRSVPGPPRPSLLVIIPFKDQAETTLRCLDSLELQRHELDVEVVIVNNRSRDPQTVPMLRSWLNQPRRHRYEIADHDGAFNYARINNGVFDRFGRAKDLILFLNNDTEILSVDCFQTMAMQAMADEQCGIVGIRLLFPDDGAVQHGGIKIWDNLLSVCGCHQIDHSRTAEEYVNDERIAFGVTFAAAMMRRTTFERLGMLEETLYPNAYGDVAMCARAVEAGLKNYYFGTLLGLHFELKSRGRAQEDLEYVAVSERYRHVFSHWMMRSLVYSDAGHTLSPPSTSPIPLRYKLVDWLNDRFKTMLGPVHAALRAGIHRSSRLVTIVRPRRFQGRLSKELSPMNHTRRDAPALRGPHVDAAAVEDKERAGS